MSDDQPVNRDLVTYQSDPGAHGYSAHKENYAKRLRRIEGQVRGIARMIDEDKYCIDVLTQISAVNSALQSVALGLLDEHLAEVGNGDFLENPLVLRLLTVVYFSCFEHTILVEHISSG